MFPQLFQVLPDLNKGFYHLIVTQRSCFLFLIENTATKKENNLLTLIIKMLILFAHTIIMSTASDTSDNSVFLLKL